MANIIGIDLGTTFSVAARLDDTGRPVIVANDDGKNITPSVVEFTSKDSFIVGKKAKRMLGVSKNIVPAPKIAMARATERTDIITPP